VTSILQTTQKHGFVITSKEFGKWIQKYNSSNFTINNLGKSLSNSGIIIQFGKKDNIWKN
jgi:hypothetical protein